MEEPRKAHGLGSLSQPQHDGMRTDRYLSRHTPSGEKTSSLRNNLEAGGTHISLWPGNPFTEEQQFQGPLWTCTEQEDTPLTHLAVSASTVFLYHAGVWGVVLVWFGFGFLFSQFTSKAGGVDFFQNNLMTISLNLTRDCEVQAGGLDGESEHMGGYMYPTSLRPSAWGSRMQALMKTMPLISNGRLSHPHLRMRAEISRFFFFFKDRLHYVALACLELTGLKLTRDSLASAAWVLGLKVCTTIPNSFLKF